MSEIFAQFCDDIRQEANGKWLLIGCYSSFMVVPQFPFVSGLACFVTVVEDRKFSTVTARFTLRSGAMLGQMQIVFERTRDLAGSLQIPLPPLPLQLSSPDEIVLSLQFDDEEMTEVGHISVQQGEVAAPPFATR